MIYLTKTVKIFYLNCFWKIFTLGMPTKVKKIFNDKILFMFEKKDLTLFNIFCFLFIIESILCKWKFPLSTGNKFKLLCFQLQFYVIPFNRIQLRQLLHWINNIFTCVQYGFVHYIIWYSVNKHQFVHYRLWQILRHGMPSSPLRLLYPRFWQRASFC